MNLLLAIPIVDDDFNILLNSYNNVCSMKLLLLVNLTNLIQEEFFGILDIEIDSTRFISLTASDR